MKLTVALWTTPDEKPANFVDATTKQTGLTFTTLAHGGFGDCSFTIPVSGWNAVRWYRSYLGCHIVIFDHLGRRLYEGSIEDTEASSEGVNVTCLGYFSHAKELTHGMIYLAGDNITPTEVIRDTVDIAFNTNALWQNDYSMIQTLNQSLGFQDFTMGKKLMDAIEVAIQYGNDSIKPRPMYFAVWDNRRCFFYEEPDVIVQPSWRVKMRDFSSSSGMSLSRTRSNVWNKIQVIYDDPDIGTAFTTWAENKDSQRLFRIREGTLNIGSTLPGIANVVRDLAISAYAFPEQSSTIAISGRVYNAAGAPDFPYMVRAGGMLQVLDYDPSVAQLVGGSSGMDSSQVFISRSTYDADSNQVELELGRKNVALDLLMTRLGLGGGGIQ
jgi:hypothetical protein